MAAAIVLGFVLLGGQTDLSAVLAQAETLSKAYLDHGQTPADKTDLLAKVRLLFDVGETWNNRPPLVSSTNPGRRDAPKRR